MVSDPRAKSRRSAFFGNQIAPRGFYGLDDVPGSDCVTLYIAVVLAIWMQTDKTAPSQAWALVQQGQSEYLSGHFAAAEHLFMDALGKLPLSDERLHAKVLADLGNVYSEQEEFL